MNITSLTGRNLAELFVAALIYPQTFSRRASIRTGILSITDKGCIFNRIDYPYLIYARRASGFYSKKETNGSNNDSNTDYFYVVIGWLDYLLGSKAVNNT